MEAPGGSPGPDPPSGVPSPSGQDELYGWRAAQSNRELYPAGIPVLTCPNKIGAVGVPSAACCGRGELSGGAGRRTGGSEEGRGARAGPEWAVAGWGGPGSVASG